MSTVPTPYTWTDGEIPDFHDMEFRLTDMVTFLMNPPMIRLRKVGTQNFTTGSAAAIQWDTVDVETENMWDATASTRIKPSTAGWYAGTYGVSFVANATGYREADVKKNGGTDRVMRVKFDALTGSTVGRGVSFLEQFNGITDYIEVFAFQNSGVTLSVANSSMQYYPDLSLRWIAPL